MQMMSDRFGHQVLQLHETPTKLQSEQEWIGIAAICGDADRVVLEEGRRAHSARKAFRRVWKLRDLLKITRMADITELDRLGIPVVTATRPSVNDAQITATQGKGMKAIEAVTSALFEAVERHSAAAFKSTRSASLRQLASKNLSYVGPNDLLARWSDDQVVEWVSSISLRTGQAVLVPAAEVLFPYFPPDGAYSPFRPSTTGLSCGSTLAEAVLYALFEVIERDAVSRYYAGAPGRLLDPDSVTTGIEAEVLDRFSQAGIDLVIIDLSEISVLPTFKVISSDPALGGPKLLVAGQGTHLSATLALRSALLETAQSRVVAIQGSREDLPHKAKVWNPDPSKVKMLLELMRAQALRSGITRLPPLSDHQGRGIEQMLRTSCERLSTSGFSNVIYTNLTDPSIGIPTVHVCVPGMVDTIVDPGRRHVHQIK